MFHRACFVAPEMKKPGGVDRPPGHRLERRLRYIRSPKTKVRPCRGIVITSFMRLDLLSSIVEYQCCACMHAHQTAAGETAGREDPGIDLPTVPPAHPADVVRSGDATSSCSRAWYESNSPIA